MDKNIPASEEALRKGRKRLQKAIRKKEYGLVPIKADRSKKKATQQQSS